MRFLGTCASWILCLIFTRFVSLFSFCFLFLFFGGRGGERGGWVGEKVGRGVGVFGVWRGGEEEVWD